MSTQFIGEIRCFGFNFAPQEWATCNGQVMPTSENETLFNLIGTTYGGDGVNTFALPNLQSRVPIHQGTYSDGTNYVLGQAGGVETVTLAIQEMTSHSHGIVGTGNAATLKRPVANTFYAASSSGNLFYETGSALQALTATTVGSAGGSQPHNNIQPYLTLNWCIALYGIYPSPD